ncbi:hypothetical protein SARC_13340 [Sphaeroforma arctica JP610]|uniref:Calcineurin-like phosphoesterase domain-containing protein n=1 Tax=Sphaeroforma arctica JP610 TaxID=667725 RepID=A0A0L0FDI6_9EUKA|nr:hypothetical protein SARC_13340 [Sphaeroforma arctica JP610]KNC74103.1 hypothetical protein SARC_13340 [Sphaeroforma arctica JP610]|eukprot:XP_014148005.1 hypothetical protein SARC_13340 [Sphaeroforma arctica JP610]
MGAPESERQAIMGIRPPKSYTSPPRNKAGFDVLKMDVTKHLTKVLKPRFVFSGHTHNHCTFVQPGCHTPELTVSTFNWRNRHDPSFVLSVIAPQKDRDPKERVNIGGKRQSSTIDDTADVESLLQAHIDKTVAGNDVLQRVEGLDEFYFGAGGVRSVRCKAPDENTVYLLYATAVCILVLSLVEMYCFSVYGAMRRALWCDVIVEEIRESSGGCCNSPAAPKED